MLVLKCPCLMSMCTREDAERMKGLNDIIYTPWRLGLERKGGGRISDRFRVLVLLGAEMDFMLASMFLEGL